MEVWQREREDEGLRREGESPWANLQVQLLTRASVDLVGREGLQRRFRLADHGLQVGEGNWSDRAGRREHAGLERLHPPHGMMPRCFDLKMEGCHVVVETRVHEGIGINARLREMRGRTAKKASDGPHGLQKGRHAEVIERYRHRLFLTSGSLLFRNSAYDRTAATARN